MNLGVSRDVLENGPQAGALYCPYCGTQALQRQLGLIYRCRGCLANLALRPVPPPYAVARANGAGVRE